MPENENTNTNATVQGTVKTEQNKNVQNQQFNNNNYQAQQTRVNTNYTNYNNSSYIPNEYKPLSPWAYVGYNLLFSLPIIGFIMMIVFAFDSSNINRRNYARSFFCAMLIGLIIGIIAMVIMFAVLGLSFSALSSSTTSNIVF